jgi:hypothetical protein
MYPAIEQFIMRPMQTGMMASEVMPGFLPSASMVQQPFQVLSGYLNQLGGDVQMIEGERKSLTAVTGDKAAAQTMIEHAVKLAKTEPVEFGTALQAFRSFSVFPGTRQEVKNNPEFRGELLDVIQRLAILTPEQGEQGASFALRELLSGQERSLKRRFNIDMETIFSAAGKPNMTKGEFLSMPGSDMISLLAKAMKKITGPSALVEKSLTTSVQVNDIRDTLMQAFALPIAGSGMSGMNILSRGEQSDYEKVLLDRNRKVFAGTMTDDEMAARAKREASIAASSPVGAMASGLRGFNVLLGDALQSSNLGGGIGSIITKDIIKPFLEMSSGGDNKAADPMSQMVTGIERVTQGLVKASQEISANEDVKKLSSALTEAAIVSTTQLVAPAAMKGMTLGMVGTANVALDPTNITDMLTGAFGSAGGAGMSPSAALLSSGLFWAGAGGLGKLFTSSRGPNDMARATFDPQSARFSFENARGREVQVSKTREWGTKLLGVDFQKGWHLPYLAGSMASMAGGFSGLASGGDLLTTAVSATMVAGGYGGIKALIPESARAGYAEYKEGPGRAMDDRYRKTREAREAWTNRPLRDSTPYWRSWRNRIRDRREAANKASILSRDLPERQRDDASGPMGSMGDLLYSRSERGRREDRAAGTKGLSRSLRGVGEGVSSLKRASIEAGSMLKDGALEAGKRFKTAGLVMKESSFLVARSITRNPIESIAAAGALAAVATNTYNRMSDIGEQQTSMNKALEGSSDWLSPEQSATYKASLRNQKIATGISALGQALVIGGATMSATGLGAPIGLTTAAIGGALTLGGNVASNYFGKQADSNMSALSAGNQIYRSMRDVDSVENDLYREGLMANLAQAIGEPIVPRFDKSGKQLSSKWDVPINSTEQAMLINQGGRYTVGDNISTDFLESVKPGVNEGWMTAIQKQAITQLKKGDISNEDAKSMQQGLAAYNKAGRTLLNNKDFRSLMGTLSDGISGTDNAWVDATSPWGGASAFGRNELIRAAELIDSGDKGSEEYLQARKNFRREVNSRGGEVTDQAFDNFAKSILDSAKAAQQATKSTDSLRGSLSKVTDQMVTAGIMQERYQEERMKNLMPIFGEISSSSLTGKNKVYGTYFGTDIDTQKIIKEDLAIDPMKYKSDPEGYYKRLQEVGKKFAEMEVERDSKIVNVGNFTKRHFTDSDGRYKTDWELEGEYNIQMQSLEAQAKVGRVGAASMLKRTKDINKYLMNEVTNPDEGMKLVDMYESAGYIIDPKIKKRYEQGMTAQGLTNNMHTSEHLLDINRSEARKGLYNELSIKPMISELEKEQARAMSNGQWDKYVEIGDQIETLKKGGTIVQFDNMIDTDTGKSKNVLGFEGQDRSMRIKGINAPELTSDEKKRMKELTGTWTDDNDFDALQEGLSKMRSEAIERFIKGSGATGLEAEGLEDALMDDDQLQALLASGEFAPEQMKALRSIASISTQQNLFKQAEESGASKIGAMYKGDTARGSDRLLSEGSIIFLDENGKPVGQYDASDSPFMEETNDFGVVTKMAGAGQLTNRKDIAMQDQLQRKAYNEWKHAAAKYTLDSSVLDPEKRAEATEEWSDFKESWKDKYIGKTKDPDLTVSKVDELLPDVLSDLLPKKKGRRDIISEESGGMPGYWSEKEGKWIPQSQLEGSSRDTIEDLSVTDAEKTTNQKDLSGDAGELSDKIVQVTDSLDAFGDVLRELTAGMAA